MSIEVAAQKFLFSPFCLGSTVRNIADFDSTTNVLGTTWSEVPFSHNHLHDLESLWWVTAWVAFHYDFLATGMKSLITLEDAKKRLDLAQTLFPPVSGILTRRDGFQDVEEFEALCQQLGPEKDLICRGLGFTREHLIDQFIVIEAKLPESVNPEESGDDIYDKFADIFSNLAGRYIGLELKRIAVIHNELLKKEMKHQRSESMDDAGAPSSSKVPRK